MDFYFIHVRYRSAVPFPLRYQGHADELFVSPNARLSGLPGMAHLDSEELARSFMELVYPKFRKRYGDDVELTMGTGSSDRPADVALVRQHSELVRARIAEGNTSSIKAPRLRAANPSLQARRP